MKIHYIFCSQRTPEIPTSTRPNTGSLKPEELSTSHMLSLIPIQYHTPPSCLIQINARLFFSNSGEGGRAEEPNLRWKCHRLYAFENGKPAAHYINVALLALSRAYLTVSQLKTFFFSPQALLLKSFSHNMLVGGK